MATPLGWINKWGECRLSKSY